MMAWNRVNRQNKKDPPKQVLLVAASPQPGITCLLQAADDIPEMHHRGSDGLNGIVVQ